MNALRFLPLTILLALAGCKETEVYTGLSEREANEMLAVVQSGGLHAAKATPDGKTWTLTAPQPEFVRVVTLLEERNYPREKFENLGGVFKREGFVSSPVEEHARLVYGLSQELSDTLSRMDGVVSARVHVAMPEADPLSDTPRPPSASVFIRYDPDSDLASQTAAIQSLVASGVEGLTRDRVTVVATPAMPLAQSHAAPAAAPALTPYLAVAGGLAGLAGGWLLVRRRARGGLLLR